MFNFFKTKKKTEVTLDDFTDEEVLALFAEMVKDDRLQISTEYLETDDGMITHEFLDVVCGDKMIKSTPIELVWPMQRLPMPEAFKSALN